MAEIDQQGFVLIDKLCIERRLDGNNKAQIGANLVPTFLRIVGQRHPLVPCTQVELPLLQGRSTGEVTQ